MTKPGCEGKMQVELLLPEQLECTSLQALQTSSISTEAPEDKNL